jgi:hypothetical protein
LICIEPAEVKLVKLTESVGTKFAVKVMAVFTVSGVHEQVATIDPDTVVVDTEEQIVELPDLNVTDP